MRSLLAYRYYESRNIYEMSETEIGSSSSAGTEKDINENEKNV